VPGTPSPPSQIAIRRLAPVDALTGGIELGLAAGVLGVVIRGAIAFIRRALDL
jgi:hypothetical protein